MAYIMILFTLLGERQTSVASRVALNSRTSDVLMVEKPALWFHFWQLKLCKYLLQIIKCLALISAQSSPDTVSGLCHTPELSRARNQLACVATWACVNAAQLPRQIPYLSPLLAVLGYQHTASAGCASRDLYDSFGGTVL